MADHNLINRVNSLKAVFIFGGDIAPAEDSNHNGIGWRSLRGTERDKSGAMPSFERVQAGAVLYRINPRIILIPSGGASNLIDQKNVSPTISSVMAAELRAEGVPKQNIIEEPQSFVTRDHFVHCPKIAREHGWTSDEIGILSVMFHFGRITGGIVAEGESAEPFVLGKTALLSAERVLASEDEKWNDYFRELYESPEIAKTLVGEAIGTGQLWTGHSPRFPNPFKGFRDPLESGLQ